MNFKFSAYYWFILLMTSISFQVIGWWAVLLGVIAMPLWSQRSQAKKLDQLDDKENSK